MAGLSPSPKSETKLAPKTSESLSLSKQQAREIDRSTFISNLADKSLARQYFQFARYKTREHDKSELIAGLIVGLAFAFIFGSGPWLNTVGIGLLAFGATLITIFLLHWVRAPSAFHKHWESKTKELPDTAAQTRRKEILAERLRDLLREAGEVDSRSDDSSRAYNNMNYLLRYSGQHTRSLRFLETHYDNTTVERYKKEGNSVLEELLAESLDEDEPSRPKIKGAIEEVIAENALPEERLAGFDYYMTIRFWLRNEGVATNFRTFDLCLFVENAKQDEYKGDRLPLAGMCLDRKQYQKTGAQTAQAPALTRLQDYDAATPLEQWVSREGWLRFVVRNVEYADISSPEGKGLVFDRLELRVTDGSGKLWTLTTKPPWTKAGPGLEIGPCPSRPSEWTQLGGGSRAYFQPRYR